MRPPAVIILGAGKSQVPFYQQLTGSGLTLIAIDQDQQAPGLQLADRVIPLSTYAPDPILEALSEYADQYDFQGLIARTSGPAVVTAARITETFKLRGIDPAFARLSTQKSELRHFCVTQGVKFPSGLSWAEVQSGQTLPAFPLIIKPDYPLVGKQHIQVIDTAAQLARAVAQCRAASFDGQVELEHFLSGPDVSVAVVLERGTVVPFTDWDEYIGLTAEGHIKGLGVQCPSIIHDSLLQGVIVETIQVFADCFPDLQAVLICSFRIHADTPYLIEIHSDLGGDGIAEQVLNRAYPDFNFFDSMSAFYCRGELAGLLSLPEPSPTAWLPGAQRVLQHQDYWHNLTRVGDEWSDQQLAVYPAHRCWYEQYCLEGDQS